MLKGRPSWIHIQEEQWRFLPVPLKVNHIFVHTEFLWGVWLSTPHVVLDLRRLAAMHPEGFGEGAARCQGYSWAMKPMQDLWLCGHPWWGLDVARSVYCFSLLCSWTGFWGKDMKEGVRWGCHITNESYFLREIRWGAQSSGGSSE